MKHILLFLGIFASTAFIAQPVITQSDLLPVVGSTAISDSVSYVDLSGQTGPNQTWDLTGLTTIGPSYTYTWVNPADAPGGFNFPTANYAVEVEFVSFFYDISDNEYKEIGFYLELQGSYAIETFSDPLVRFEFPLEYGDSGTDTYESAVEFGLGFTLNSTGSSEWTVEGYGTAILPFGTFTDALLIHVSESSEEVQEIGGMEFVTTTTNDVYALYKAGFPLPLAIFEELTFEDLLGSETTYNGRTFNGGGGVAVSEEEPFTASVFPNPTDGIVQVQLQSEEIQTIELWTTDGRFVQNFSTNGRKSISLDMSELPAGVYVLIANGAEANYTSRVIRR